MCIQFFPGNKEGNLNFATDAKIRLEIIILHRK